eukprot:232218_1
MPRSLKRVLNNRGGGSCVQQLQSWKGGEVVAEAIDIVAATRADRIWIAWSESCNSLRTTEIPGTAPTSPFEDGQEEEQQWYAEVIPDEIQPVSVLGDGIGQHQQQECNDGEIPDMTFPASPSEVREWR